MAALSLEELYDQHIKPRPAAERLRLLEMTAHDLAQTPDTDADNEQRHSIMELHGLGKEIWEGIDAQQYVNELRSEWDHRP